MKNRHAAPWTGIAALFFLISLVSVWFALQELYHPITFDAGNVAREAIRLNSAGSIGEWWHIATHPDHAQPPLRSVPVWILMNLVPAGLSLEGVVLIYQLFWRTCAIAVGLTLTGWAARKATPRHAVVSAILISPVIVIVISRSWFWFGWVHIALVPAVGAVLLCNEVSDLQTPRRRYGAVVCVAALSALTLYIDVEPALAAIAICSLIYIGRERPHISELVATGASGAFFIYPMSSASSSLLESWVRDAIIYLKVRTVPELFHESFDEVNNPVGRSIFYLFAVGWLLETRGKGKLTDISTFAVAGTVMLWSIVFLLEIQVYKSSLVAFYVLLADFPRFVWPSD